MSVCLYVCMAVCMYVCLFVCIVVRVHVCECLLRAVLHALDATQPCFADWGCGVHAH